MIILIKKENFVINFLVNDCLITYFFTIVDIDPRLRQHNK